MKALILALAGLLFFASTSQSRIVVHDDSGSEDPIYKRCRSQWGADYQMQEFCVKQQFKFNGLVIDWYKSSRRDNEVYQYCGQQWQDQYGMDWIMVASCINGQQKAKGRMTGR